MAVGVVERVAPRRRARRGLVALVVGALGAAGVLTACTNRAELAAEVGGEKITVAQFEAEVQKGLDDPAVGKVAKQNERAYRAQVLGAMIQERLAVKILQANDLPYTKDAVDAYEKKNLGGLEPEEAQQQALAAGQAFTLEELRKLALVYFMYDALGKPTGADYDQQVASALEQLQASKTTYDLSVLYFTDPAQQQAALAKLQSGEADAATIGATLTPLQDGTPQPQAISGGLSQLGAPDDLNALLAAAQTGSVIPYTPSDPTGASTTSLIVVVDQVTTKTDDELQQAAETQVAQASASAGQTKAAAAAKKYDVYLNPRFGSLERPKQGLPSVAGATPPTFSEPGASSSAAASSAAAPAA